MSCMSQSQKKFGHSSSSTAMNRAKTAGNRSSGDNIGDGPNKKIQEACKKTINNSNPMRLDEPIDMNFNDMLIVTRASSACQRAAPTKRFNLYPTLMPKPELQRLNKASKFVTLEERVEEMNRIQEETKRLMEESQKRKEFLKEIDDARMKAKLKRESAESGGDGKDDEDNRGKVLERAFVAKYEQEEEVKRANRIILNAKCHVVRDAQIHEKYELIKEIKDEALRLDRKMINNAMRSLEADDIKVAAEKEVRKKYADEIKKQLEEREYIRILEYDRMEEEKRRSALANLAIQRDEQLAKQKAREKRDLLRKDLHQVSEMTQFFKQMIFDQEKAAELQVQAYMKTKEERERKIALEKRLEKEAKQRKQQILFNTQQKILSLKSEQGEVALRRDQENKEREFRRKEKEAALKRISIGEELKKNREMQLNEMKQRQALQMARNEDDFKRTVNYLKSEEEKAQKQEAARSKMRDKYRAEIIRQMNQNERERREGEVRAKNEFFAWKEKEEMRDKNIRSVIKAKLQSMRDAKLPEKYIKDVEKQLNISMKA